MRTIKVIGISILILFVSFAFTLWILKERRDNLLINPDIYPAFRKIEIHALIYTNQKLVNIDEYERCRVVLDHMRYPYSSETDEEYYTYLSRLGFNLPPFKLKESPKEEHKKQCIMEADRLLQLQTKIIENQIKNMEHEIEYMIKPQKMQ